MQAPPEDGAQHSGNNRSGKNGEDTTGRARLAELFVTTVAFDTHCLSSMRDARDRLTRRGSAASPFL